MTKKESSQPPMTARAKAGAEDVLAATEKKLPSEIAKRFANEENVESSASRLQLLNAELTALNAELEAQVNELSKAAERERRERIEELQTLLEALPVGVFISHDAECLRITANSAGYEMLGRSEGTNLSWKASPDGSPPCRVFQHGRELPVDELPMHRACGQAIDLRNQEYRIILEDGTEKIIFGHATPLFDQHGKVRGGLAIFMNLTAHKKVENELRELTQSLEHRVAERTQQLRSLAMKLTTIEQRERRRAADLIHGELQQLLTAAIMKLHLLNTAKGNKEQILALQQEIENLLRQAIGQARSITQQLSPPILQYSGLPAALEWLAEWMKTTHGLAVKTAIDSAADPHSEQFCIFLFEAVRELLFNVVKHAGVDTATLRLQRIDDKHCRIQVADNGVGCEAECWQNPDHSSEKFGLFSIKDRLDLLGCSVHFDSTPDKGFRAEIIAPIGVRTESEASAMDTDTVDDIDLEEDSAIVSDELNGVVRILVVDDHSIVREGIITLLEREPDLLVVGEAADGQEALDMVRRLRPDVIMMDVNMPCMNGIQATRAIKEEFPDIQIIGLSMNRDEETRQTMLEAGASDYFPKDWAAEEICTAIKELARSREM